MKKFLCATALGCVLALGAMPAIANHVKDEKESFILHASHSLPANEGEEFRKTLHEADDESVQLDRQIQQDHADMYDILTAPEFNRKAFLAKAKELRALHDQMKENRDEAFGAAFEQLSPQSRTKLAHALENHMEQQKAASHHHHHKQHAGNSGMEEKQNARSGNTPDEAVQQ